MNESTRDATEAAIQERCRWRTEGHTSWVELESVLDFIAARLAAVEALLTYPDGTERYPRWMVDEIRAAVAADPADTTR